MTSMKLRGGVAVFMVVVHIGGLAQVDKGDQWSEGWSSRHLFATYISKDNGAVARRVRRAGAGIGQGDQLKCDLAQIPQPLGEHAARNQIELQGEGPALVAEVARPLAELGRGG